MKFDTDIGVKPALFQNANSNQTDPFDLDLRRVNTGDESKVLESWGTPIALTITIILKC